MSLCISVPAKSDQHPAAEIRSDGSHSKLLRLLPRRDRVQGDRLYADTSDTLYPKHETLVVAVLGFI